MPGADAIVIGAGAAGIAAARRLHEAGLDVLLIEASDRIGGRARSIAHGAIGLDLGCGWLHSARRNPWVGIAERAGFTVDRSPSNWDRQWRDLGFSREEQDAAGEAWERWEARARAAATGPDRALADFVAADDPWRPWLDALSGFINGAPLARVSLHDWLAYEDAATDDNWRVREGYGALVADHGRGLPIRLGCTVRRIDHRGVAIRVETDRGTLDTARVAVCVPTLLLADESLAFDPPLPAKAAAANALPLGLADKVFLAIAGAHPDNAHLLGNPHSACTASYQIGLLGQPVVEGFFGGDCVEAIEREGPGAAANFAIGELVALLGSDWGRRLTPIATSRWRHEPFVRGSYSHADVGSAGQRAVLAAPVDDRLFFAGEACSVTDFSTAHGAYATGIAAAEAILALHQPRPIA